VFLGKRDAACPINDVTEWTDWFSGIMASPVDDSNSVDLVHADVASDLHLRQVVSPSSMVSLNEPITVNEVVEIQVFKRCPAASRLMSRA
jgi:hypothetical protein